MKTRRLTLLGMLIAISILLSYIEAMFPPLMAIPGVKLGLANIPIMFGIYKMRLLDVFLISFVRILIISLTFRNMLAFLFSLSGALLSILVMLLLKRSKLLSVTGVSIAGGVAHNIGQILIAVILLETSGLLYYLPFLIIAGIIAGSFVGLLCGVLINRVDVELNKSL